MLRYACCVLFMFALAQATRAQYPDFVEAAIDNTSPYVGQPITYTFRLYDSGEAQQKRVQPPAFNGFGQGEERVSQSTVFISGVNFTAITQDLILYPTLAGDLTIAPFEVIIPETPFQEGATLQTEAFNLTVRPLPGNAPDTFRNAIGQYDISVRVSSDRVRLGDALTLTLSVSGSGNLQQVLAPPFTPPTTWRSFDNSPNYQQDTPLTGTKTFTWTLIPSQIGDFTLPPVRFTYFDPQSAAYSTRTSATFDVNVTEGSFAGFNAPTPIPTVPPPVPIAIKPLDTERQDILPDMTFWLLWGVAPILYALAWLITRLRPATTKAPRPKATRNKALQKQLKNIEQTAPREAHSQIAETIRAHLRKKAGHEDINTMPLPDALKTRLNDLIQQAENARYAPVSQADVQALLDNTTQTLNAVDKAWRR